MRLLRRRKESRASNPSLVGSTVANIAGMAVPLAVQLITVPLYFRLIGTNRYGVLCLVWLLLGYFGLFDLGFGRAIASRIAKLHDQPAGARARVFWTGTAMSVLTGAIGALILYLVGRVLFADVFQIPPELRGEAQRAMPLIAATLPVATCASALSGALQGRQAFVSMNVAQIIGMVLYQVSPLVIGAFVSVTMPWLVAAAITGQLVTAAMLLVSCMQEIPTSLRPVLARSDVGPMLAFGGWVTVSGIVGPVLTVFDRFVIGVIAGVNAVAIYSVPYNILLRVSVLPVSWQSALFPRYAMVSEIQSRDLFARSVRFQAWMMTPIVLAGMVLMKPFLSLWVGESFAASAAPVGQILFAGLWFNALAYVPYSLLQSRGRPDLPAKFHVVELLVYAPALWFLIQRLGVAGAAWAWGFRVALDAGFLFWGTRFLSKVRDTWPGLAWVVVALGWTLFDISDPMLNYAGDALLLTGCAVWAWRTVPREASAAIRTSLNRDRLTKAGQP